MVSIYDNTSKELMEALESHFECFRLSSIPGTVDLLTSCSNNVHSRDQFRKYNSAILPGMTSYAPPPSISLFSLISYFISFLFLSSFLRAQAVRRTLNSLPINSQSYSPSPYCDQSIFSFDERAISSSEKPRAFPETPIKVHSRKSGSLKFKVGPPPSLRTPPKGKRIASYIFHPHHPFMIAVHQNFVQPAVVNFHAKLSDVDLS